LLDFAAHASLEALTSQWDRVEYMASDAKDRLGLNALLMRPDGVVAWAVDADADLDDAVRCISRWFGEAAASRY
jgi:hypothetical protein